MAEYSRQLNVLDQYKGMDPVDIKNVISKDRFPFATLMEHWQGDFNFGTMIRNSNIFGANHVYYYGKRKYDRRGTVGAHHYVDLTYLESFSALEELKNDYVFVALDNNIDFPIQDIRTFDWPRNSLMIFGEEGPGLSRGILDLCDHYVSIPQFGSVRSLNCGTASGIAMYDYISKVTT